MKNVLKKILAVVLSVVLVPTLTWAQTGTAPSVTKFDTSFNIGPVAVSLQMTNPIQAQSGVVWDTLHVEVRDDTQTPPFHGTLDAVGQAANAAALLGGFLPAAILVQKEVASGISLAQAVADAQKATGVTITSFHDATMTDYSLLLALISVILITGMTVASPPLNPQMSAILSKMQTSLAATGGSDLATFLSAAQTSLTAVGGNSTIP